MQEPASSGNGLQQHPLRHRPLIPVLIGFSAGIAADGLLNPSLASWIVLGCAVLLLALCGTLRVSRAWGRWAMAALILVPIGGAYHLVRFRDKPSRHLCNLLRDEGWRCHVRGSVTREPEPQEYAQASDDTAAGESQLSLCRIEVEALSADGRSWHPAEGGLSVFIGSETPDLLVGDEVQFIANIRRYRPATNPGETDFRAVYARQGMHARATVPSGKVFEVRRRPAWYGSIPITVGRLRSKLKDRLIWSADPPIDPITSALVFGERGRLGQQLEDLLSEAGSFHFLAISGLHVGIFAAFIWALLGWLRPPVRIRPIALIVAVWLYALFTGMRVSSIRAALMLSIVVAAPLFERRYDSLSALVGAALIVLLFWPQQLFTAGFQLTFVAVWAVTYLYPELARVLWPWDELILSTQQPSERTFWTDLSFYTRRYLLLSACVWLAVAPVTAYHFHRFSFLTPLINLLLWPLVLLLVLSSFVLTLSALLGAGLSGALIWVTAFLSRNIESLLGTASRLPGFVVYAGVPPIWWIGLFYVVVAAWVLRARFGGGRTAFLAGVLVLGVTQVMLGVGARRSDGLSVIVADVGHGQCVVFRLPSGAVMMYDAGSRTPSRGKGVAGILWHGHARRIQKLLISHRDADHSSFLPILARRFSIGEVLIPPSTRTRDSLGVDHEVEALGLRRTLCAEGTRLAGEGLQCVAIHPSERFLSEPALDENEKSLVLRCSFGHLTMLLTGDIEEQGLRRLVSEQGEAMRADVLLLPHHGTSSPGLREFVEAVRPRVAAASCGEGVDDEVRRMLAAMGVPLWTTAEDGAIVIEVAAEGLTMTGFRSGRRVRLDLAQRYGEVAPAAGSSGPEQ